MQQSVQLIEGGNFTDARGTLGFVNDFNFTGVKRFYTILHPDKSVVRAWQGHKLEHKYFFVTRGKFLIACVLVDNWENPSAALKVETWTLTADRPAILSIPPGYANGIKALEDHATLISFSDADIETGNQDNWRFDSSLWLDWSKY